MFYSELSRGPRLAASGRELPELRSHPSLEDVFLISSVPPTPAFRRFAATAVAEAMAEAGAQDKAQARQGLGPKIVIVDRLCGEAVLKSADIFVRGVLTASQGIERGGRRGSMGRPRRRPCAEAKAVCFSFTRRPIRHQNLFSVFVLCCVVLDVCVCARASARVCIHDDPFPPPPLQWGQPCQEGAHSPRGRVEPVQRPARASWSGPETNVWSDSAHCTPPQNILLSTR